ncbi:MAG TPA: protein kinase, partial [Kofleriaceae bacterium]
MASEFTGSLAPSEPSPCPTAERIAGFIDGELSPSAERMLERHLAACPPCRKLVSALCQADSRIGCDRASSIAETIVDPASRSTGGAGDDPAPREPALVAGTRIGRYTILERIGAGGMGVVYAALDPELDRKVAIKILRGDGSDARSRTEREARLRDEARAMAQLAHPNVVAVFEIDRFHDQVFLVMELVAGQTLAQWLHDKPRNWRAIVEVFVAAGQGLAAAHAAGLVHRDFKPVNVLVGLDGRVRVTDFGLVQDGTLPGDRHRIAGTPGYMAPEQFRGESADARTDQFNFCVALYRALYGQRPFTGDTLSELADEVTTGRLRPPPTARVPRWLARAVV